MASHALTGIAETLLDKTILPGYSKIGYSLRRRWWPADAEPGSLIGKRIVVTGGSSGLGRATAAGIAELGGIVHLVGRKASRLEESAGLIRRDVPTADVVIEECDVSDLDAVRAWCADLRGRIGALHAIVHDAGVMPPERTETAQGHEMALATHVLGPFLMTELLRENLAEEGYARVVWMSSGGMYSAPFTHEVAQDLEFRRGEYNGTRSYARTKRMQVVVAAMLSERLAGDGIFVHSLHPGWADTPGVTDSLPGFAKVVKPILRTAEQGADTAVWLVGSDDAVRTTGQFWQDRRPRPMTFLPSQVEEAEDRQTLWDYCCEATGVTPH
ncbi:MAG: SDR family NAD(P)-dependent oxidoreductase [Nocardioidaceae bacterium]|nr:SDR family NAD(P)-dependent oxidoreductase [Nocardioidaceae bacterium]